MASSTPRPYFTPWKDPVPNVQEAEWSPGPVWTGGKSRPTGIRSPDRPARSQSLYRLSYRAQFCSSKAISVTYCECVFVALVIQRELRMRRIILMYLSFLFIPCFYILFQKRKYSQENGIDHKLCVCFDFPYKMCLKCFAF